MAKISKELISVNSIIEPLLRADEKYRNSHRKLCVKVWVTQMGGFEMAGKITAYNFIMQLVDVKSKYFSPLSIARARRKIQSENPELATTDKTQKKMQGVETMVEALLTSDALYRDNDLKLCAKIWCEQVGGVEQLKKITAFDLFLEYIKDDGSKLFNATSIVRCREDLQATKPELRGSDYRAKKRLEETDDVKLALGYKITQ